MSGWVRWRMPRAAAKPPAPTAAPRRGRPRREAASAPDALGPARIFEAALALIDEHGLAAFNIRALAGRLAVAPAAIYWHVANRDALVSGAIELALRGVGDDLPPAAWQATLRAILERFRAALRRHPELAHAIASEMAYNAAFDAPLLDRVVAALESAGFADAALVDAFNVVVAAMCGFATLELCALPAEGTEDWRAACRARVDAIDPRRQPSLHARRDALRDRAFLLRWTDGVERPLDTGFAAWVDVIVSGLEARAHARTRA